LRAALRLNADYLPARLKLAENLLGAGEWEQAAELYQAIIGEYSGAAEAHYGIGRIRASNGDLAGAAETYQKAWELFPAYGAAHYGLAQTYRRLGNAAASAEHVKLHAANKTLVPDSRKDSPLLHSGPSCLRPASFRLFSAVLVPACAAAAG
jgi:tetratricopeptide (TPR) repeat protein